MLVLFGCHGNHGSLDGTCHNKLSAGRPYVRPFPFQRYARSSIHTQKCARFRKAPNRYHKVRIVRYVRRAINVLFLPLSVRVRSLLSPFQSVHLSRLVPSASQGGLFRLRKKSPCLQKRTARKSLAVFNRRGILGEHDLTPL